MTTKLNENMQQAQALQAKFVENVFRIFDNMPIGINFVDDQGKIIRLNQLMLDYFSLTHDDEGKHIQEVEPTSRLPVVLKTRKAEMSYLHRFANGKEAIVHRIPVIEDGQLIGALGIILFGDLQEVHMLLEQNRILSRKIAYYEQKPSSYKAKYELQQIIGTSDQIKACKEHARRIARSNAAVLILGESGVGKELFAHAIHQESSRRTGPFVRVNCAAIPETLLEAELFGYEEGAFTGAKKGGQAGKFELADGGTLFLDEVGEMPYIMQAKLLRVLQEKEFERVGGKKIIQADVRIISATNVNLEQYIANGGFRSDLFYRLNVLSLKVPPLRERRDDIPSLIYYFLDVIYQEEGLFCTFAPDCVAALSKYSWPGNARELRNVVEKIVVEAEGKMATAHDIPTFIQHQLKKQSVCRTPGMSLVSLLEQIEAEEIKKALTVCKQNRIQAAEYLGIPKVRLYRKLKKYQLE